MRDDTLLNLNGDDTNNDGDVEDTNETNDDDTDNDEEDDDGDDCDKVDRRLVRIKYIFTIFLKLFTILLQPENFFEMALHNSRFGNFLKQNLCIRNLSNQVSSAFLFARPCNEQRTF